MGNAGEPLKADVERAARELVHDLLARDFAKLSQKVAYPLSLRTENGKGRCPDAESEDDLAAFVECILGPSEAWFNDPKNLGSLSVHVLERKPELEKHMSPTVIDGDEEGPFARAVYWHSAGSRGFVFAFRRELPLVVITIWMDATVFM